jgi:hypothetical protein
MYRRYILAYRKEQPDLIVYVNLYLNFLHVYYSPEFTLRLFSLHSMWLDSVHGNRNIGCPLDPQSFVPE